MNDNNEVMAVQGDQVEAITNIDDVLNMVQRRDGVMEKLKGIALKATNHKDWVDQSDNPYLTGSGAEKARARIGLSVWNVSHPKKEFLTDDAGDYYYFTITGTVGIRGLDSIEAMGTCSSRHKFFAWRNNQWLPMQEVDITNIQKAAYTNFLVNGITRFLGLRNLTWEELKEFGIDKTKVQKVEYKSGGKDKQWSEEHKKKAHSIGNFLLAKHDGNKPAAQDDLEKMTSFKATDGKEVKGKRIIKYLSGKQIDILYKKLQKDIGDFESSGTAETEKTFQQEEMPEDYQDDKPKK